jgi:hypothetical protein
MNLRALTEYEKDVFVKLQKEGPLTKKALLKYFDYKPSTLNRILSSMMGKGAIITIGQEESSGGRKPFLFDINTHEKYIIGIDNIQNVYICGRLRSEDERQGLGNDIRPAADRVFAAKRDKQHIGNRRKAPRALFDLVGKRIGRRGRNGSPVNRNTGVTERSRISSITTGAASRCGTC